MSLNERIKPFIFSLGLVLGLIGFIIPAFADTGGTYTAYYSSDYNFRVTDIYFDVNDLLTFKFDLPSTSSKSGFLVLINNQQANPRPSLSFSNCSGTTCTGFGSESGSNYVTVKSGYFCEGTWNIISCGYSGYETCYEVPKGNTITCRTYGIDGRYAGTILNPTGITKQDLLNNSIDLENTQKYLNNVNPMYLDHSESYYQITGDNPAIFTSVGIVGTCGTADKTDVSSEPTGIEACATGTVTDILLTSNYLSSYYSWFCAGTGGRIDALCTADLVSTVNGTCGTANGTTIEYAPIESAMCSSGFSGNSIYSTVNGWTWSCYGNNNGTTDNCSAINSDPIILPTNPTEDCDTYSGIDKILCNLSNNIQGIFLPSQSKLDELQTTMNKVGNVFPFNYLRVIGTTFSNMNITQGGMTMTFWGTTAIIPEAFYGIPIIAKMKIGFTIIIYIGFIAWAISYIKHFFK